MTRRPGRIPGAGPLTLPELAVIAANLHALADRAGQVRERLGGTGGRPGFLGAHARRAAGVDVRRGGPGQDTAPGTVCERSAR